MTKATVDYSTRASASRRGFLTQAAVVAAGGAALGMALPLPVSAGSAERVPDPILAAIETHKAARSVTAAAVDRQIAFEREMQANGRLRESDRLPDERQRGDEIETLVVQAHDAEVDVACTLVNILPTTMAGVMALLRYAVDADVDGEGWPRGLASDDGSKIRDWQYFLIANLAEILPDMGGSA